MKVSPSPLYFHKRPGNNSCLRRNTTNEHFVSSSFIILCYLQNSITALRHYLEQAVETNIKWIRANCWAFIASDNFTCSRISIVCREFFISTFSIVGEMEKLWNSLIWEAEFSIKQLIEFRNSFGRLKSTIVVLIICFCLKQLNRAYEILRNIKVFEKRWKLTI